MPGKLPVVLRFPYWRKPINEGKLQIPATFLPKLSATERKILLAANLANAAIYSTAQSADNYRMMGTTLTGVLLENDCATAVHVGDSRLYLLRNNKSFKSLPTTPLLWSISAAGF